MARLPRNGPVMSPISVDASNLDTRRGSQVPPAESADQDQLGQSCPHHYMLSTAELSHPHVSITATWRQVAISRQPRHRDSSPTCDPSTPKTPRLGDMLRYLKSHPTQLGDKSRSLSARENASRRQVAVVRCRITATRRQVA